MRSEVRRNGLLVSTLMIGVAGVVASACATATGPPADFVPTAINDGGTMVGEVPTASAAHRAIKVTSEGTVVPLGGVPDSTASFAVAVNGGGAVAGYVASGYPGPAVWTSDGVITLLRPDAPSFFAGISADINESGAVVGFYATGLGDSHAFVAEPPYTAVRELLPPTGFTAARALAINDHGVVVGVGSDSSGATRGLRWALGDPTTVEVLEPDAAATSSAAIDVNDDGVVLGATSTTTSTDLVTWTPGTSTAVPLPAPPGTSYGGDDSRSTIDGTGAVVTTRSLPDATVRPFRLDRGSSSWTALAPSAPDPVVVITGCNDRRICVGIAGTADVKRPITIP